MPSILADHNATGNVGALVECLQHGPWHELWQLLAVEFHNYRGLGLDPTIDDRSLWLECRGRGIVLITGNRNARGPDSLDVTIRESNTPDDLPVVTLANPGRVRLDRAYASKAAERLLEILLELDALRGSGRLWIPGR